MAQNYDPNQQGQSYYDSLMKQQPQQPQPKLEPPAKGIFAKWLKVTTRPGTATFASEMPDANWNTTLLGAVTYALVYALLLFLFRSVLFSGIGLGAFAITDLLTSVISAVIGLFIGSGVLYFFAKLIGQGQGDFMTQTYLYSLYTFPLAILTALLGIIPLLGSLLTLAIAIYELFLTYYMLQPAHNMRPEKARQVVFVLVLVGLILGFVLVFFTLSLLGTRVNFVMSRIGSGLNQ
jgi:hypothetical protein